MNSFKDEEGVKVSPVCSQQHNINHLTLALLHKWVSLSSLDMNLGQVNISP